MHKSFILLAALIAGSVAVQPAEASGDQARRSGEQPTSYLRETALFPVKLLAVPTAFVIGAPIAVLAEEAKVSSAFADALSNEFDQNGVTPLMVASLPGQTLKLISGVGVGIVNAARNSVDGLNEPFSSKSFSLDELE